MQEVLGEVTELFVDNIDQHPYHHHVQPYQIVSMLNDSDDMNAWWRVRCLARLLPWAVLRQGVASPACASASTEAPCRAGAINPECSIQLV